MMADRQILRHMLITILRSPIGGGVIIYLSSLCNVIRFGPRTTKVSNKLILAVADGPARRSASRASCCTQIGERSV